MRVFLTEHEQQDTYMRLFMTDQNRIRIWLWDHDDHCPAQFIDFESDKQINELISELQDLLTIKNKNNG